MTAFATPVQSASLLCQPPDILITWLAASPRPIAVITWLSLTLPEEQAAPALTQKPARSSIITAFWAGKPGKYKADVLARRGALLPITSIWGQAVMISFSALSRQIVCDAVAALSQAASAAPKPAMPGRFSVPARLFCSWPPPRSKLCNCLPARQYSAPTPDGPPIL